MCTPENIASRRCSRPAARARSTSRFNVSRVDAVLAVVDVQVADGQRQFAAADGVVGEQFAEVFSADLVVMPRHGLPCGSGWDIRNLLGIGGHCSTLMRAK